MAFDILGQPLEQPPNKQRLCDQHLKTILISTNGATSFAQQTKNGVIALLLVSPQIQKLFRLDEIKPFKYSSRLHPIKLHISFTSQPYNITKF
jgi:hypothetical protein